MAQYPWRRKRCSIKAKLPSICRTRSDLSGFLIAHLLLPQIIATWDWRLSSPSLQGRPILLLLGLFSLLTRPSLQDLQRRVKCSNSLLYRIKTSLTRLSLQDDYKCVMYRLHTVCSGHESFVVYGSFRNTPNYCCGIVSNNQGFFPAKSSDFPFYLLCNQDLFVVSPSATCFFLPVDTTWYRSTSGFLHADSWDEVACNRRIEM